ncbi:EF-hand domain-containing protein [uncultured Arcticibacterium sp.]|uniref:EF-hand domain-containing protein n=1 Tax=uncultured Arcticibacterium sp. TaxID=2173042 RepID=UPI0030FA5750
MTKSKIAFLALLALGACKSTEKKQKSSGGNNQAEKMFLQMDANKDGKLSKSEVKGPLANDFSKIDLNNDGFISKEEFNKAPKPNGAQQGGGRPQGPPRN